MDLNLRTLARISGILFLIIAISMILPLAVGIIYGEGESVKAFLLVLVPSAVIGLFIIKGVKTSKRELRMRDGFIIVASSWIFISAIGALPYVIEGCIPRYVDAFFETSSGFTTTGASILVDIEALPKSMLFWRSFAHWIGGMGILVFAIALLPALGIGGQTIVRAETPGPTLSKVTPKMSDTARVLYITYGLFTITEVVLLMFGGLSLYDSLLHSFGTLGTGGFSNYSSSVAAFDSAYVDGVITVFMIMSGISFNLYFIAKQNGLKEFLKDAELRLYIIIIASATGLLTLYLFFSNTYGSFGEAFRYSVFQATSIITTTGYATADFGVWPTFCVMILFCLFFVGGCSSSTGGGIKVIRVLVLLKMIKRTIALKLHPNALVNIKVGNKAIASDTAQGIASFVFLYLFLGFTVGVLVSLDNYDLVTSFSASLSCLGNIGPGFESIGPIFNYSIFSEPTKVLLSFTMIAGRLELFTLLMLLSRKFWNPNH